MICHLIYTQIDFKICLNIDTDSNWWVHGFKYLIAAQPTNQFMESIFKINLNVWLIYAKATLTKKIKKKIKINK